MTAQPTDHRKRDLARIHCLAKELGLDDDEYRDVLWVVARVRSSAGLDAQGRKQVIQHLQSRVSSGAKPRPSNDRADLAGKVEAQMRDLDVDDAYTDAIAHRMFGIERWRWCSPAQMKKLVAALWYSQRRRGRKA